MGLVIDTSAIISLERNQQGLELFAQNYGNEVIILPAIVWSELLIGVRLAKNAQVAAKRRAFLEQMHFHMPIINFDEKIAEIYADIFSDCLRTGRKIPQNDCAIASTAIFLKYSLLVGPKGEEHFKQIDNLNVIELNDS